MGIKKIIKLQNAECEDDQVIKYKKFKIFQKSKYVLKFSNKQPAAGKWQL